MIVINNTKKQFYRGYDGESGIQYYKKFMKINVWLLEGKKKSCKINFF
jgi:hypothetical protein